MIGLPLFKLNELSYLIRRFRIIINNNTVQIKNTLKKADNGLNGIAALFWRLILFRPHLLLYTITGSFSFTFKAWYDKQGSKTPSHYRSLSAEAENIRA
jgi:hypothetical protein